MAKKRGKTVRKSSSRRKTTVRRSTTRSKPVARRRTTTRKVARKSVAPVVNPTVSQLAKKKHDDLAAMYLSVLIVGVAGVILLIAKPTAMMQKIIGILLIVLLAGRPRLKNYPQLFQQMFHRIPVFHTLPLCPEVRLILHNHLSLFPTNP